MADDGASVQRESSEVELKKLDDQIVLLRRKHDRLHESNQKKRAELDLLTDKLKDLHSTCISADESPEKRLREAYERLVECANKYDDEHRTKMAYEQVIKRLRREQLDWPADVKQLEALLLQKENDYEQLLVMSHDANASKDSAKIELGKFEGLVQEERKQREKELQERRVILQKKQSLASELDRTEHVRPPALARPRPPLFPASTARAWRRRRGDTTPPDPLPRAPLPGRSGGSRCRRRRRRRARTRRRRRSRRWASSSRMSSARSERTR